MKKPDDCRRINDEFEEFMNAPPPTEEEARELLISFEISGLEDAMAKAMDKPENRRHMAEYNRQIEEIRAWQERKEILTPEFNYSFLIKILDFEKDLGRGSELLRILRETSTQGQENLAPAPQQPTEIKQPLSGPSETGKVERLSTNKEIKAFFEPACINTIGSWAKKAGIIIEQYNGKNEMVIKDATVLRAIHQKYYDTKRKKGKKLKK